MSVYIDNSSSDKVYFDNFEIERTEATVAVVVQENHYYPFGMNMKGIEELDIQSLDGTDEYRWQFNGVEKNESFGLNWNETFYRTYDMQLGRWNQIDPLAEKFANWSSYHGMGNNPILIADPYGDDWYVSNETGNDQRMWFDDDDAATKHFGKGSFINLGEVSLDEVTVTGESESNHLANVERYLTDMGYNIGKSIENTFGDGQNMQGFAQGVAGLNPLVSAANVYTGYTGEQNIFGEKQGKWGTAGELASLIPGEGIAVKGTAYLGKGMMATVPFFIKGIKNADKLNKSQIKSISSYHKEISKHLKKLDKYIRNPFQGDNKGFLKNAPNEEIRQKIIRTRVDHLRTEIRTFQNNIQKIIDSL